ncbi:EcsC family protein [Phenylobacterium sp.]|uniref:EcsC family protein n=1 Tax=Phenylobacterium sp. TaxID=1871053 RepID=UPI003982FCF4
MAATPPFGEPDAAYEAWAAREVAHWRQGVLKPAGPLAQAARGVQQRINRAIPEKVHAVVTGVIERMTRTILTGADMVTADPLLDAPLKERDQRALKAIADYKATAAVEGGVAGAGGFLLALADFPALIAIKIKLLFDLAAIYGKPGEAFAERLYLLHLFQLAFSSAGRRADVFHGIEDWDARDHPESFEAFDWRTFQQEYRDYIDLAKMAQLIPVVGAPIGAFVNFRLLDRLGETAMNGYRMRWLAAQR